MYFDETSYIRQSALREGVKFMDVFLKRSGNNVGLYIDQKLNTVFENHSIEDVVGWVNRNLLNAKIHILK